MLEVAEQWAGVSPAVGVWDSVPTFREVVLGPSSGPGLGQGQSRSLEAWPPTFRARAVWKGSNQGKVGMLGICCRLFGSDTWLSTVDLRQPCLSVPQNQTPRFCGQC